MNYPNQLDDKNSLFEVKDLGRTSTSKPLDAVELEIEIDNPINFPTGRHIVVVESEVIIISHRIDNILYVEKRGAFDTLSENHITNSKIGVVFTSAHYETLRDSIIDIQKELWTYRKPVNDVLDDPQTIIPVENESYLVGLSPLNEFIGKENNIATWNGTSWDFISPQPAFEMYILNKGKYEFNGTSWVLNKDVEISNVNDLQNQLNNRYTKSENDNLLNTKVDKETGKSLVEDTKVSDYDSHLVNIANPHNVTALQVGAYSKSENDNLLDKKANLDINNKIPLSEIPDSILGQLKYMGVWDFGSGLPTGAEKGNYWIASVSGNGYEVGDWAVYNGTSFDKVDNTDAVSSVAGRTGNVVLNKNDVGLNNVDNTSDLNKPISTATQTALDTKQDNLVSGTNIKTINGESILGSGDLVISGGGASPLNKPVITSPINGATNFNGSITSTYSTSNSYKGEQDWVKWEASTDANFTNIIYNYEGSSNLTSWVPNMGLDLTTVYVRTKQGSDNHLSSWSDTISFTTPDIYIENPTLTVAGAPSSIGDKPVLTTSAFSVFNGTDTHISTDWIIEQSGTVIWSSMNNTTNKVSITVPAGYLVESTEYTFKVRHNSANYGSSSYVTVTGTTKAQFFDYDAGFGLKLEGGYYAGKIQRADGVYALIIAPKALGFSKLAWKNANTTSGACKSLNNGAINTAHMVASGSATVYPAAHYCNNLIINGYSDWYLPARDELEIAYRNFKPTTEPNTSASPKYKSTYVYTDINDGVSSATGVNSHSIPAGTAYTLSAATNPAQTPLTLFKQGGGETFYMDTNSYYLTSTEFSATEICIQSFSGVHAGFQNKSGMSSAKYIRAFRAVKISG